MQLMPSGRYQIASLHHKHTLTSFNLSRFFLISFEASINLSFSLKALITASQTASAVPSRTT